MMRRLVPSTPCLVVFLLLFVSSQLRAQVPQAPIAGQTQVAGENINMVSGTVWPAGDQFLQRQNEPSMAVSSRNPEHLLAGANDYRTVDIAKPGATDYRGDAWLGVFTTIDGGESWKSTPLPGYPQDSSAIGKASPLYNIYNVATDPTVRAGTDGIVYYSGLAFNRGNNSGSAVFVSTFQDLNNKGNGNGPFEQTPNGNGSPFLYLNTVIVDTTSNQFVDKPWIAVDVPRPGRTATCTINGRTFSSGYVYLFYTFFNGSSKNPSARINVAISTNCGASWSKPQTISQSSQLNQGTVAAIDPGTTGTGTIYVSWRQEGNGTQNQPDQILYGSSSDGGSTWTTKTVYTFPNPSATAGAFDLDENTTGTQFRGEDIPSLAVDGFGRVWVAFSQRVAVSGPSGSLPGSRIYVTTLPRGSKSSWTTPYAIDASAPISGPGAIYGHQLMPSLTYAFGRIMAVWLDTRWDNQQQVLNCNRNMPPSCTISHSPIQNSFLAAGRPDLVFTPNITDPIGGGIRHTVDVFGSMLMPSSNFNSPTVQALQISQYKFYFNTTDNQFEQGNFNPPNLPMFVQGTQPFLGDYLDVAAQTIVPSGNTWTFNTDSSNAPVFHATWTDNRDVVPPPILAGPPQTQDWTRYSPPGASSSSPSIFNPSATESDCQTGYSGDRNQDVYTARITAGLVVRFKENAKPLTKPAGGSVQRSFSLYVRNTVSALVNPDPALYRILIGTMSTSQACSTVIAGGMANFAGDGCQLDVAIPPRTTISRAIVVNSKNVNDTVNVLVAAIDANGNFVSGGLQATAALNNFPNNSGVIVDPDQIAFDPTDPDSTSPSNNSQIQLVNGEFYDPTTAGSLIQGEASPSISSPSISSPSISSPSIFGLANASPSIASPSIASPSIASPSITAVQTASPSIVSIPQSSPSIASPSIASPSIVNLENSSPSIATPGDTATDYSFTITNKGDTSASYNAKEFVKQMGASDACRDGNCQIIIHRTHGSPTAAIDQNTGQAMCTLAVQVQDLTQANIPSPAFSTSGSTSTDNSSSANNATVTLGPGEGTRVTLRVFGNTINNPTTAFPIKAVAVGTVPDTGATTNPASLTITSTDIPVAVVGQPYTTNGMSGGSSVQLMSIGGIFSVSSPISWFPFNDMPTTEPQPLGVPGFSLSPSGVISADMNMVTAPFGSYPNVNVEVKDSATPVNTDAQTLFLEVNQFSISSVVVNIGNTVGTTSYLHQGEMATVTVNVSNQGPATANNVNATLTVNAIAGGTPSGPMPIVTCSPTTLQPVQIGSNSTYGFVFNCTTNSGNGYVSFTGNSSGQYFSPAHDTNPPSPAFFTTLATAVPVTTPVPAGASNVPNSMAPDVIVDTVKPTLTFTSGMRSPAPNFFGWNNSAVTIPYSTGDNLSGVKSHTATAPGTDGGSLASGTVTFSSDGANQTSTVTVTDFANNSANFPTPAPPVNIDTKAPVLSVALTTADGKTYVPGTWTNQTVTVVYTCVDELSGVATSRLSTVFPMLNGVPAGAPTVLAVSADGLTATETITLSAETSGTNISSSCSDKAGNVYMNPSTMPPSMQLSTGPIMIDKTPPTVTGSATTPNGTYTAGTWTNQSPVTVTFSCTDTLSGPKPNSTTGSTVVGGPTQNANIQGSCMDNAGNTGNGSFGPVLIDQRAPAIMITSPAPAQTLVLNSQISPVFTCNDGGGGDTVNCIASPSASPYTATPVGAATFTVSATDQAGNQSAASANYLVIYSFTGFQAPLQPATLMNPPNPPTPPQPSDSGSFTVGTTIPIAGTLQDAGNNPVADGTAVTSIVAYPNASCSGPASGTGTILYNSTTGTAAFSYDTTKGQFLFNWNTTGMTAGCDNLVVTTKDTLQWSTIVHLATDKFVGFDAPLTTASAPAAPSSSGTFDSGSTIPILWQLLNGDSTLDTAQNVNVSNVTVYSNAACSGAPQTGATSTILYDRAGNQGTFTFQPSIAVYTVNWTTGIAAPGCYDIVVTLTDQSVYTTMVTLAVPGGVTTLLQYNFDNVPQGPNSQTAPPSYAAPNIAGGAFGYSRFNANGMFSNGCAFADCIDPAEVAGGEYYSFSLTNNTTIANASISFNEFNNDCQVTICATPPESFSVQYDTDPAFSNPAPTTVANFSPPSPGFASYTFPINGGLPAGTYYLRITANGVDHDGTAQYVLDNVTISGSH